MKQILKAVGYAIVAYFIGMLTIFAAMALHEGLAGKSTTKWVITAFAIGGGLLWGYNELTNKDKRNDV